jgi:hypothetical protein
MELEIPQADMTPTVPNYAIKYLFFDEYIRGSSGICRGETPFHGKSQ